MAEGPGGRVVADSASAAPCSAGWTLRATRRAGPRIACWRSKALGLVVLGLLGALVGLHSLALLICRRAPWVRRPASSCPDVLLYNAGLKRQEQIRATLPDALDLLTICVESGLGFDAALGQVAAPPQGPLAAEFARVLAGDADSASRVPRQCGRWPSAATVPELRAFVSALVQSTELGIPVSRHAARASQGNAGAAPAACRGAAQQVPVKITFPLIGCLLPGPARRRHRLGRHRDRAQPVAAIRK